MTERLTVHQAAMGFFIRRGGVTKWEKEYR